MKYILLALLVSLPSFAFAAPTICRQSSGALFYRTKCKKGETSLNANTLKQLGLVTLNKIIDYSSCRKITPTDICTLDSDAGIQRCTVTCATGEILLTAGVVPTNPANYSLGSYPSETYSTGEPISHIYTFKSVGESSYSAFGTCCPRPS